MVAVPDSITLRQMDARALNRLEKEVADQFMGGLPWGSIAWGLGNLAVWLSLWPLTLTGVLPLWAAFPIATLNVMLSYLPSHEAQHRIIAREGEPLFWLNELVGYLSTIPLVLPYQVARLTHYEHHTHCNDPVLDPDAGTKAAWLRRVTGYRQPVADRAAKLVVIEREEGVLGLQAEARVIIRQYAAARRSQRAARGGIDSVEEIVDPLAEPLDAFGPITRVGDRGGKHLQLEQQIARGGGGRGGEGIGATSQTEGYAAPGKHARQLVLAVLAEPARGERAGEIGAQRGIAG
jgi:hypothetical protein